MDTGSYAVTSFILMTAYLVLNITLKPRPMQRWEDVQVGIRWWCWPFSVTCCHGWTCRYNWLCMVTVNESGPAEEGACYKYNIVINSLLQKAKLFFMYKIYLWLLLFPLCHPSIQILTDSFHLALKTKNKIYSVQFKMILSRKSMCAMVMAWPLATFPFFMEEVTGHRLLLSL